MVRTAAAMLVLAAAGAAAGQAVETCVVSLTAVQALNKGDGEKRFAPGLEAVKKALEGLDYRAFQLVKADQLEVPFGQETRWAINDRYTLYFTPVEKTADRRIRLKTRITMKRDERDVKALDTTLIIEPDKHLNLGGLRLEDGELIVVVSAHI